MPSDTIVVKAIPMEWLRTLSTNFIIGLLQARNYKFVNFAILSVFSRRRDSGHAYCTATLRGTGVSNYVMTKNRKE